MGTVPRDAVQAVKLREATAEPSSAQQNVEMKTPRDVPPEQPELQVGKAATWG